VTEEAFINGNDLEFDLTNIRSNSRVVAEIPFESLQRARQSNRSKRSPDELPEFYCTLVGEQFTFNASEKTSQVWKFNYIFTDQSF